MLKHISLLNLTINQIAQQSTTAACCCISNKQSANSKFKKKNSEMVPTAEG